MLLVDIIDPGIGNSIGIGIWKVTDDYDVHLNTGLLWSTHLLIEQVVRLLQIFIWIFLRFYVGLIFQLEKKTKRQPVGKACRWFSSGQKSRPKIFSAFPPDPHHGATPVAGELPPT